MTSLKQRIEAISKLDKDGLKRCPFCGGGNNYPEHIEYVSASAICCGDCNGRAAECCNEDDEEIELVEKNDWMDGQVSATKEWNKRPLEDEALSIINEQQRLLELMAEKLIKAKDVTENASAALNQGDEYFAAKATKILEQGLVEYNKSLEK